MVDPSHNRFMKNGDAYEIHPCIDPSHEFTPERWKSETRAALKQMSARSLWQRFAGGVRELSESQLDYLTDVDGVGRVAWCAVVLEEGVYHGIGVSRYVRLQEAPEVAEFAVTVIDPFQGQGVGRALLERLIASARDNRIKTLRGFVFPDNGAMLNLCRSLGGVGFPENGVLRVDIPVHPLGEKGPDRPQKGI